MAQYNPYGGGGGYGQQNPYGQESANPYGAPNDRYGGGGGAAGGYGQNNGQGKPGCPSA